MSSKAPIKGLEAWIEYLSKIELPVLAGVMQEINAVTRDQDASAQHMAQVILKDASLTAKVLRIANSAHFKHREEAEVTTISRAVVKLGFRGIRAISLSVMLIDSLLKKSGKQRMQEWLARGFHAAVQAQLLADDKPDIDKEDVFVAALLLHLGEMAFWSSRGEQPKELDQQLPPGSPGDHSLEKQVIGTTLAEITSELAKRWDISDTLREAIDKASNGNRAAAAVRLGDRIALAAEQGWNSEAMNALVSEVARFNDISEEQARQQVLQGSDLAASVAITFGANKVCHYIPSRADADEAPKKGAPKTDSSLQLKILRELASMVQERIDINTLFQMVLEGVHRGVGFERAVLCLSDARQTTLQPKYLLGNGTEKWQEGLKMPIKGEQDNLLAYCVHRREILLLDKISSTKLRHLVSNDLARLVDTGNCALAALYAGQRNIGLLLADRGIKGEPITQEQFESFSHFAQQANMALAVLASQSANASNKTQR